MARSGSPDGRRFALCHTPCALLSGMRWSRAHARSRSLLATERSNSRGEQATVDDKVARRICASPRYALRAMPRAGSHHPVTLRVPPLLGQEGSVFLLPASHEAGWRPLVVAWGRLRRRGGVVLVSDHLLDRAIVLHCVMNGSFSPCSRAHSIAAG